MNLTRKARRGVCLAFTLIEAMVVTGLLLILITGSTSAIYFMDRASRTLADRTAAMAVIEAQIYDIRALEYIVPSTWLSATNDVRRTNNASISLDQSGQTYRVAGTVIEVFHPVPTGSHLVTVTGTFQTPGRPLVVSLQTVVDRFSGGQQ